MKIANFDVSNVGSIEDVKRFISQTMAQVITIINGRITLADNFDGKIVSASFTAVNTDTAVTHGLGRTAIGYILVTASAAMSIYTGSQAGDGTTIFLRSNNPGSATILVF